jgi:hypothetical protein
MTGSPAFPKTRRRPHQMRIFLSCLHALKPHPVPAYGFWEHYFRNALAEAGHEIVETPGVDWAEGLCAMPKEERAQWLERTWTRTVDFLGDEHRRRPVHLFLGYLFPNQVDAGAVKSIRSMGIPTVNFFCDNMREFTRVPETFRAFDLHWVPEAGARSMYASEGVPFIYLPMPMWVPPGERVIPAAETPGVIFMGSHDELREDLLGRAVARGLDVRIFGAGWLGGAPAAPAADRSILRTLRNQADFVGSEGVSAWFRRNTQRYRKRAPRGWIEGRASPPLRSEDYQRVTRNAQVVVGINRCPSFRYPHSNPLRYSRLRDIEAPMLGACYLTETAPGLADLFEIGSEIEAYGEADELVEKARLLQGDPARRLRLRQNGQRRALADHTISRSLGRIAQTLGISA